jgi:hypothetical protein
MPDLRGVSRFMILLPLIFLYNNCQGGFRSNPGTGTFANNSQCKLGPKTTLKLMNFQTSKHCTDLSSIICESRVFKPNINSGLDKSMLCAQSGPLGGHCLEVQVRNFNTSSAEGSKEDFEVGGAYNYEEFNCYYSSFKSEGQALINSTGASLEEALGELHSTCYQMGEDT